MYLGGILLLGVFPLLSSALSPESWLLLGLTMILPAGIDGTSQMFLQRESSNRLRLITGLFLGIGITLVVWGIISIGPDMI